MIATGKTVAPGLWWSRGGGYGAVFLLQDSLLLGSFHNALDGTAMEGNSLECSGGDEFFIHGPFGSVVEFMEILWDMMWILEKC